MLTGLKECQRDVRLHFAQEIVEPAPGRFTHHLELHSAAEIDDQVRCWLQEVWQAAAQPRPSAGQGAKDERHQAALVGLSVDLARTQL